MSKAKKAGKQLFIGGLFSKFITFIGSIVLARLLFPEDYGYLLIAMIITSFASMLGNMGFENYYLQEKFLDEQHRIKTLNITFKLRLITNIFLFVSQYFLSYYLADFYDKKIIGELLRIFAFDYLITAITQINLFILRKELNYKPEVIANISRDIVGTIGKVSFALSGFGALSFAIGAIAGSLTRMIILLKFQSFIPDIYSWDKVLFAKIYYFGKHSLIAGVGNYFTNQIDKILLSIYFPPNLIGYYSFANTQSSTIFSYLIAPQGSLIISYSAKHKDNIDKLFVVLSRIGYLIGLVTIPIVVFLTFYAEPIIIYTFGSKWQGSVEFFQIFLIYYLATEITFPFSGILTAFGLPQINSKIVITRFVFLSIGLWLNILISDDIYHYLYTFTLISFVFSWIKLHFSLKQLGQNILVYLTGLGKLSILLAIYVVSLFIINSLHLTASIEILLASFTFLIITIIWNIFLFRIPFIKTLELVLSNNNKLLKHLRREIY